MKKTAFLLIFLTSACQSRVFMMDNSNIEFLPPDTSVIYIPSNSFTTTQENDVLETALRKANLIPINSFNMIDKQIETLKAGKEHSQSKGSDIYAKFKIIHDTYQSQIQLPIQRKTMPTSYTSSFVGNTLYTDVNYDYETVGYKNVPITQNISCVGIMLYHYQGKLVSKPKPHVETIKSSPTNYNSLCTNGYLNDEELLHYAKMIYGISNIQKPGKFYFRCSANSCK